MSDVLIKRIKRYVGFSDADAENVRSLAGILVPQVPQIVDKFYEVLLRDDAARSVFTGGDAQMERQRQSLGKWLRELFERPINADYVESRSRIGKAHTDVGLPQRYMVLGMEIIWSEFQERLNANTLAPASQATTALGGGNTKPDPGNPVAGNPGTGNPADGHVGTGAEAVPIGDAMASLHKLVMLDLTLMLESYMDSYAQRIRAAERGALRAKLVRAEHLAEVGQLAASLAHEIKNPLAGISGAIQVIGDSLTQANPHRKIIGEILGQISRMDATVRDLLMYARPSPPARESLSVAKLFERVMTVLAENPDLEHVEVVYVGRDDSRIYADPAQLEQLLINLVLNAAQASRGSGRIELDAREQSDRTVLIVRDAGDGMPPEILARATEPFFTSKAKGTGLGLAICRRICESNLGNLSLESREGHGTTVYVDFPQAV